jgi:penicillin-binding protein 2
MFERRLKIFLLTLLAATLGLLARAERIQVAGHEKYTEKAAELGRQVAVVETTRGQILDREGRVLATDEPCTDACVDYRAIPKDPDTAWVASLATARLAARGVSLKKMTVEQSTEVLKEEDARVRADIDSMWATLATLYPLAPGETQADARNAIQDIRNDIVQQVAMKRRTAWYQNFQINKKNGGGLPRWEKWLSGESNDGPDVGSMPANLDDEVTPHLILPHISDEAVNILGKQLERFPGLVLQSGTRRRYPLNDVACQVLGRLGSVTMKERDAALAREYLSNDLIGKTGIEKLCEPLLRGERGSIETSDGVVVDQKSFVAGRNVQLTIDAEMQAKAQDLLQHVCPHYGKRKDGTEDIEPAPGFNMHGAIAMINVKTSEIIVLASNPNFDANVDNNEYMAMEADEVNAPLRDRATCDQFEPGSTVKPVIGAAAITSGLLKPLEGIECTGYLMLPVLGPDGRPVIGPDGQEKKIREPTGRCWMASEWTPESLYERTKDWEHPVTSVAHHPIPVAHRGHDGNPDGFLTYSDALERSCNVFFETVADRLSWPGEPGLAYWYKQFGFGQPTGIGIEEVSGLLPGMRPVTPGMERMTHCFAGIGEGQIWATPLQIANEAATFARGGIRMRPRLLSAETREMLDAELPAPANTLQDRFDLHLDPAALEQARIGMREVVNDAAGTGFAVARSDMIVAGKTGTAQGTPIEEKHLDKDGKLVKVPMKAANRNDPPTGHDWYRSGDEKRESVIHAWFMGYAPADDPQIAFCVLVEYAGEGGGNGVAGSVASQLLQAAVDHGYLHPTVRAVPMAVNFGN